MRILVACEYSATVRDAFRKKGHDAWSCDIIETDGNPDYHFQCDARLLLNQDWDMLIAHPPCQYLTNCGTPHLYKNGVINQERYNKGIEAKNFFMMFLESDIEKICVENSVPSRIYELPPYTQIVHPYMFGERYMKRTCLWLKGLEPLKATKIIKIL